MLLIVLFRWNKSLLTFRLLDFSVIESCWTKFHGQKSLTGYSPWGSKESDTTEQLTTAQQFVSFFILKVLLFFASNVLMLKYINTVNFSQRNCVCKAAISSLIISLFWSLCFQNYSNFLLNCMSFIFLYPFTFKKSESLYLEWDSYRQNPVFFFVTLTIFVF